MKKKNWLAFITLPIFAVIFLNSQQTTKVGALDPVKEVQEMAATTSLETLNKELQTAAIEGSKWLQSASPEDEVYSLLTFNN